MKLNTKAIRIKMAEKDLNRREVADIIGVSELTIRRILAGKDCRLSTLLKLTEALELQPEEAITE